MKKLFTILIAFLFCVSVQAQKEYYVYFQSDKGQSFYLKAGNDIFNSSNGYLIVPQLVDTTYFFSIGFPGGQWTEQYFKIDIDAKDRGFLLKNFDNAWGLVDVASMTTLMATNATATSTAQEQVSNSAFTKGLAKAANDPGLLIKRTPPPTPVKEEIQEKPAEPIAKTETTNDIKEVNKNTDSALSVITQEAQIKPVPQEETKSITQSPDTTLAVVTQETVNTKPVAEKPKNEIKEIPTEQTEKKPETETPPQTVPVEEPNLPASGYQRSQVTRLSESSTVEGFGLIFLDRMYDGQVDTIRILIPENKQTSVVVPTAVTNTSTSVSSTAPSDFKCDKRAYILDVIACKKRLLSQTEEINRLAAAATEVRQICYTTKQIKEISEVFTTEENKFRFFESAIPYVFDKQNLDDLSVELKNAELKEKFQKLL